MLSIRFLRIGKKHQPSYKIVVVDKRRSPKSGKFVEQLGFYNPITKEKGINKERVQYWLSQGAQSSDTVYNFLVREGIIKGKKIAVHSTKKKKKEPARDATQSVAGGEEAPKEEPKEDSKVEPRKDSEEKPAEEKKPAEEGEDKEKLDPSPLAKGEGLTRVNKRVK